MSGSVRRPFGSVSPETGEVFWSQRQLTRACNKKGQVMKSIIIALVLGASVLLAGCNDGTDSAANGSNTKTVEFDELVNRLNALEEKNTELELQVEALQFSLEAVNNRSSQLELELNTVQAEIDELNGQNTQTSGRLDQVELLLTCVDYDSSSQNIIVENCNLIVRDGSGSTASSTGLGNLIVGYNSDGRLDKDRTGSHNLVIGDEHQYSSYGGFVAGIENSLHAPYASISGGKGIVLNAEEAWAAGDIASMGSKVTIETDEFVLTSNGDIDIVSNKNLLLNGNYDALLEGTIVNISGASSVNVSGGAGVNVTSNAVTDIQGSLIQLNGSGMPAARFGDSVSGSVITSGSGSVLIGN